jgi:MFS family permease
MDPRAAGVVSALAVLAVASGYLGTLLTQTITYAAAEFHAGKGAQGVALAAVRFDVILSFVLVAAADRRGRRRLLLATTATGAALTVFGAAAPSLAWLAGSQTIARAFVTASGVLILIVAAEEMPAGCRAYAVSLLAMSGALGSGIAVMLLPLAGLGPRGWRIEFVAALLWLLAVGAVRRVLPESQRFEAHRNDEAYVRSAAVRLAGHGRRLWLLAVSALLLQAFVAPASQFQNEFLRTEQHFSAARITTFILLTNTPGGLGIILGGRLADLRGRRGVAVVGLLGGSAATVLLFLAAGWTIWVWSIIGSVVGAAVIPALGVYGPELFPTGQRGRANGVIKVSDRIGSIIGLLVTGWLSARIGRIGPAIAALSVGPLLLAVLVVTSYPETAHLELEDLNPEDR